MNFNFNEAANISQNTSRRPLEGNQIHAVKFDGVEIKDMEGKQAHNAGVIYQLLELKFSNEDGYFTHSIFAPKDEDFKDRETQYGPNPSNVKSMMLLFVALDLSAFRWPIF